MEGFLGKTITAQIICQLHVRAPSPTSLQKFSSNEPVGVVNTDLFTMVSIQQLQGWDGSSYNVQPQPCESAKPHC